MTVLDAFAVLAVLKDEPAARDVERLIRSDPTAALTALGVAEVLDHLVRVLGVDEEEAVLDVAQVGLADPAPVDGGIARHAALLRARHYHRGTRAVSVADCVAAEIARRRGVALVTADPHLLDMCVAEGIGHVVLADARGHRWRG